MLLGYSVWNCEYIMESDINIIPVLFWTLSIAWDTHIWYIDIFFNFIVWLMPNLELIPVAFEYKASSLTVRSCVSMIT
jgi:hypothetical protein